MSVASAATVFAAPPSRPLHLSALVVPARPDEGHGGAASAHAEAGLSPDVRLAVAAHGVPAWRTIGNAGRAGIVKGLGQFASATAGFVVGAGASAALAAFGRAASPVAPLVGGALFVLLAGGWLCHRAGNLLADASGLGRWVHHTSASVAGLAPLAAAAASASAAASALAVSSTGARGVAALTRDGLNNLGRGALGDTHHVDEAGIRLSAEEAWHRRDRDAMLGALVVDIAVTALGVYLLQQRMDLSAAHASTPDSTATASPLDSVVRDLGLAVAAGGIRGLYQLAAELTKGVAALADRGGLTYEEGMGVRAAFRRNLANADEMGAAIARDAGMRYLLGAGADVNRTLADLVDASPPGVGRVAGEYVADWAACIWGALAEARHGLVVAGRLAGAPLNTHVPRSSHVDSRALAAGVAGGIVVGAATAATATLLGVVPAGVAAAGLCATATGAFVAGEAASRALRE
ncbi:hypothetical protein [Ramlibacter sp.]|uniref:hypothetical protein n=1 Tax=Ramlibacter sp. TaxID=1917967 RepID=UPI003D0B4E7C